MLGVPATLLGLLSGGALATHRLVLDFCIGVGSEGLATVPNHRGHECRLRVCLSEEGEGLCQAQGQEIMGTVTAQICCVPLVTSLLALEVQR